MAHDFMQEKHRLECEARYWLAVANGDIDQINEIIARIRNRRGHQAAEILKGEMRRQWRIQKGRA